MDGSGGDRYCHGVCSYAVGGYITPTADQLEGGIQMKTLQKGFTLIELMIVVAIIGILSFVALTGYQDFSLGGSLSVVFPGMSACRTSITEVYQSGPTVAPVVNGWAAKWAP